MNLKEFGKSVLYPHIAVMIILLPVSAAGLVLGMLYLEEENPLRIAAYVVSFYELTVWCLRIPDLVRFFRNVRDNNKYAQIWLGDTRLRVRLTLTASVLWNAAYAALQLGLGIYHRSFWFFSLAGYYLILAVMRFFLARHTSKYKPREKMPLELKLYRICGWGLLLTNLALTAMMICMIMKSDAVKHNMITTISMAAYTFLTLAAAIVNVVKYRSYHSPVYSASKAVTLAASCVSMITLEETMLATFSDGSITPEIRKIYLSLSGGGVFVFIIAMAVYMIARSRRIMQDMEVNDER